MVAQAPSVKSRLRIVPVPSGAGSGVGGRVLHPYARKASNCDICNASAAGGRRRCNAKTGSAALCSTIGYVCVWVAVIHAPTASVRGARDKDKGGNR
jgi:hypothetical protein